MSEPKAPPCDNYRVDLLAAEFGQCVCGHLKSAHTITNVPAARTRYAPSVSDPGADSKTRPSSSSSRVQLAASALGQVPKPMSQKIDPIAHVKLSNQLSTEFERAAKPKNRRPAGEHAEIKEGKTQLMQAKPAEQSSENYVHAIEARPDCESSRLVESSLPPAPGVGRPRGLTNNTTPSTRLNSSSIDSPPFILQGEQHDTYISMITSKTSRRPPRRTPTRASPRPSPQCSLTTPRRIPATPDEGNEAAHVLPTKPYTPPPRVSVLSKMFGKRTDSNNVKPASLSPPRPQQLDPPPPPPPEPDRHLVCSSDGESEDDDKDKKDDLPSKDVKKLPSRLFAATPGGPGFASPMGAALMSELSSRLSSEKSGKDVS